jgi:aspartate beta-hydroxylase
MIQEAVEHALAEAVQANRAGRRNEAAELFRNVLASAGEQPVALNALGVMALDDNDPNGAADFFRRAQAADPQSPELSMNLAKALRIISDEPGEQAALESALAIDQRHFMALVRLAELFERQGNMADAAARWNNVLAMAAMIEKSTPDFEAMLEHARNCVARERTAFAEEVDLRLAETRDTLSVSEHRRFDASIDYMLGRRQIYVNNCAGLHFPFLPAEEFFERSHFPWLSKIEAMTDIIRGELEMLLASDMPGFIPYIAMEPGTPVNKWSVLDRKPDWSALHLWKNGQRDDAVCARCPLTAAAVQQLPLADIPGRAPTVFFSLLRPGVHLPAHTGVSNIRTIIHLPLIVPRPCSFRVGGETREWCVGEAWAFDDTIEHEAWNRSNAIRAILIFDVWNPHITAVERNLLREFFPVADRHGHDMRAQISD